MSGQPTIWLCEGEPDWICALSHGLTANTATGGAGSWRPGFNRHFKGRDVVIAYDADLAGYNGAHKVAAELAKVAGRVRILIWPDEMLAPTPPENPEPVEDEDKGQAKKRAQAAASATREDIAAEYVPRLPAKHGQDLTDYLVTHKHGVDELEALLEHAEEIELKGEDGPEPGRFWGLNPGNNLVFKPALLAAELMEELDLITDPDSGLIYRWCGTHYKQTSRQALEAAALTKLGNEGTSAQARDAINQVELLTRLPEGEWLNQAGHLLCLPNGMLDLDTAKILPHDKNTGPPIWCPGSLTHRRPLDCPRWKQYLGETMSHVGGHGAAGVHRLHVLAG
jgi:putative DNA primase/helicase